MMTTDTPPQHAGAPPRKRGAPKGNRNAWKHGQRSAAARAEREAARTKILDGLPDVRVFDRSFGIVEAARAQLQRDTRLGAGPSSESGNPIPAPAGEGGGGALFPANKANNSEVTHPEGAPRSHFSSNETNNSARARRRGAPQGNRNALKHGTFSGKRRQFDAGLRNFRRQVNAICEIASAIAREPRSAP